MCRSMPSRLGMNLVRQSYSLLGSGTHLSPYARFLLGDVCTADQLSSSMLPLMVTRELDELGTRPGASDAGMACAEVDATGWDETVRTRRENSELSMAALCEAGAGPAAAGCTDERWATSAGRYGRLVAGVTRGWTSAVGFRQRHRLVERCRVRRGWQKSAGSRGACVRCGWRWRTQRAQQLAVATVPSLRERHGRGRERSFRSTKMDGFARATAGSIRAVLLPQRAPK